MLGFVIYCPLTSGIKWRRGKFFRLDFITLNIKEFIDRK